MTGIGFGYGAFVLTFVWAWTVFDIARHDRIPRNYKVFWILFTLVLPIGGTLIWLGTRPPRKGDPSTGYFSNEAIKQNL